MVSHFISSHMASALILALLLLLCRSYGGIAHAHAAAGHVGRKSVVVPARSFQSSDESCSTSISGGINVYHIIAEQNKAIYLQRTNSAKTFISAGTTPQYSSRVSMPLAHRHGPCAPVQAKDEMSLAVAATVRAQCPLQGNSRRAIAIG
jgi:hypothetical protein